MTETRLRKVVLLSSCIQISTSYASRRTSHSTVQCDTSLTLTVTLSVMRYKSLSHNNIITYNDKI